MATKTIKKKTVTPKPVTDDIETKVDVVEEKEVNTTVDAEKIAEAVVNAVKKSAATETKEYGEEDLILCKSITGGELIYIGNKSGNRYVFADKDDTCEIEVRDLNSLRASKSQYLYSPLFVIEDEDFVNQPRYKEINDLYESIRKNDIDEILNMPLGEFKRTLTSLPDGFKKALENEVATRIHNDEFDSLGKIKAIDEICGTDLYCLIK